MNRDKAIKQFLEIKKYKTDRRLAAERWDEPWKTLIATLLSARTLDGTTIKVCNVLFEKYSSYDKLANASLKNVMNIIKPVNYYKNKSKYIIECCNQLKEFSGIPPFDINSLIKLKGVGKKTANVYLAEQGFPAIGVDTHVARISNKLNWTKNKEPNKIEEDLMKLFPKSRWRSINYVLVNFGQSYNRGEQDKILDNL